MNTCFLSPRENLSSLWCGVLILHSVRQRHFTNRVTESELYRIPSNGTENGAKEISRNEGSVADIGMDVRASRYVLLFRGLSGNKGWSANASFEKYQQTPVFVNLGFSERIHP